MNREQDEFLPQRPLAVLIATAGDEGGLLARWLTAAARDCDYPVRGTSVPSTAPRTGAAMYYLEIYPVTTAQLHGRVPVMALMPTPGEVDVVIATELVEAGQALQDACVNPACTTLIASTHRVYTLAEKVQAGDGRIDSEKLIAALRAGARHAVLLDMARLARRHGSSLDAVLFGALVGTGALPMPRAACERAMLSQEPSAQANLRAFEAGFDHATGMPMMPENLETPPAAPPVERVRRKFPQQTFAIVEAGVARLIDYQDAAYADLYLDRMEPILALDREAGGAGSDYRLTRETARRLALWMSYEDVIRVADLKTRAGRYARIREEAGARYGDVVTVTDYLAIAADEWRPFPGLLPIPQRIETSSLAGFLLLRCMASLRRRRRGSARYLAEHALMERWLGAIKRLGFAVLDVEFALEIAQCAALVQGYGAARREGMAQFRKIFDTIVEAGNEPDPSKLAVAIRRARQAALADPDFAPPQKPAAAVAGKPIFWMPRVGAAKCGTGTLQPSAPESR